MKLGAHPLIVAAAFGLLGPLALAEDEEEQCEPQPRAPCKGCTCDRAGSSGSGVVSGASESGVPGADSIAPAEVEAWVGAAWEALLR